MQVVNVDLSIRPVSYAVRLEGTDHDRDTESPRLQPRTSRAQPVNVSLKQTTPNIVDAVRVLGFYVDKCCCWILSDLHRSKSCMNSNFDCHKIFPDELCVKSACPWRASGFRSLERSRKSFFECYHIMDRDSHLSILLYAPQVRVRTCSDAHFVKTSLGSTEVMSLPLTRLGIRTLKADSKSSGQQFQYRFYTEEGEWFTLRCNVLTCTVTYKTSVFSIVNTYGNAGSHWSYINSSHNGSFEI